jgi:hypothetical protein
VTEQNLGVPRSWASFAVPLGVTTKMDGCAAIYPALAAIFVAQFFGVDLGVIDYLLIALVSVIGSAATAGVTGAVVMLTLTLSTLDMGPHRGERGRPGAGADHRRQARGHPRPRALQLVGVIRRADGRHARRRRRPPRAPREPATTGRATGRRTR